MRRRFCTKSYAKSLARHRRVPHMWGERDILAPNMPRHTNSPQNARVGEEKAADSDCLISVHA